MSEIFSKEFERLDHWRKSGLQQLDIAQEWLDRNKLVNAHVGNLLKDMRARLQDTQLKVAFVAEFSRGKSELINAIFFANSGRRIMPASVGRTTMCPVEIGYNEKLPPCIRLLPLETRLQDITLAQWRYEHPEAWVQIPLDVDNPERLAETIKKVSERQFVTQKEAVELGFWDEETPQDNPSMNAVGMVEIPKWRDAIVNYPHPLLKRGIAVLDTPGLNTVGVEPELTLELLPQAHAIIFVLAADTGVTRSDLQIWKDYLSGPQSANRPAYVVLNKIDVLWDGLLSSEEATRQLNSQKESCASLLNLPSSRILAVSAQKGLLGKIKNDFQLLQDSKLPFVERLLVRDLLPQRQKIQQDVFLAGIEQLNIAVHDRIANRQKTLQEELVQLQGADGKNADILKLISEQIIEKKEALTALRQQASAMRQIQKRKLWLIQKNLSHNVLDKDIAELAVALKDQGMRLGLSKIFNKTIDALRDRALKIEKKVYEFEELLISDMKKLEIAYGIVLTIPPSPGAGTLASDVEMLKTRYESFFGLNQAVKMRRGQYAEHMFRTLLTRVRSIFDEMYDMLNMWSNNAYSVLVAQATDKDEAVKHLYQNIQRIQSAKEPLSQRIEITKKQEVDLLQSQVEFDRFLHTISRVAKGYEVLMHPVLDEPQETLSADTLPETTDMPKNVDEAASVAPAPDQEMEMSLALSQESAEQATHESVSEHEVNVTLVRDDAPDGTPIAELDVENAQEMSQDMTFELNPVLTESNKEQAPSEDSINELFSEDQSSKDSYSWGLNIVDAQNEVLEESAGEVEFPATILGDDFEMDESVEDFPDEDGQQGSQKK